MSLAKPEQMYLLFSVLPHGRGKLWRQQLEDFSIFLHLQIAAHGTASSEMRDILGLETTEKDLILSLGAESAVASFAADFSQNVVYRHRLGGLLVIMKPTAVNHLLAVISSDRAKTTLSEEAIPDVSTVLSSEYDYSFIVAAVNRGYTDDVMKAARLAGAAGGTIIRGRLADTEKAENFYGMELRSDKDILTILTSSGSRDAILEAINKDFGLRSPAQTIICALPVEKAYKI